jgi:hypothetical protein
MARARFVEGGDRGADGTCERAVGNAAIREEFSHRIEVTGRVFRRVTGEDANAVEQCDGRSRGEHDGQSMMSRWRMSIQEIKIVYMIAENRYGAAFLAIFGHQHLTNPETGNTFHVLWNHIRTETLGRFSVITRLC